MNIIENMIASGETIPIDDKHFVKCKLKNCRLLFAGGDFALTDTALDNCQVQLSGPAQKTASLLTMMGIIPPNPGFSGPQPVNLTRKPQ